MPPIIFISSSVVAIENPTKARGLFILLILSADRSNYKRIFLFLSFRHSVRFSYKCLTRKITAYAELSVVDINGGYIFVRNIIDMSCLFKSVGCVVISREIDRVIIISVNLDSKAVLSVRVKYLTSHLLDDSCGRI